MKSANEIIQQLPELTCIEDYEKVKEYCDKEIKLIRDKLEEIKR